MSTTTPGFKVNDVLEWEMPPPTYGAPKIADVTCNACATRWTAHESRAENVPGTFRRLIHSIFITCVSCSQGATVSNRELPYR